MHEEAEHELLAMKQQQVLDLESEWEAATAMVDSQINAKAAERKQREEEFQRKQLQSK